MQAISKLTSTTDCLIFIFYFNYSYSFYYPTTFLPNRKLQKKRSLLEIPKQSCKFEVINSMDQFKKINHDMLARSHRNKNDHGNTETKIHVRCTYGFNKTINNPLHKIIMLQDSKALNLNGK